MTKQESHSDQRGNRLATAALAVSGAAVVIVGLLLWRVDSRLGQIESRIDSAPHSSARGGPGLRPAVPQTDAPLEPTATDAPKRRADGVLVDRQVSYDSFRRLWKGKHADAAETNCWKEFPTSTGADPPEPVHFVLTVDADGKITKVEADLSGLEGAEIPKGFPECVADEIRKLRFPAPGAPHQGRVQADRPRAAAAGK